MLVQMLKCIISYCRQPLHVLICDQNTTGIFAWKSPGFRLDPQSLMLAQITVCWGLSNRNCHSPSASGKPWLRLSSFAVCWGYMLRANSFVPFSSLSCMQTFIWTLAPDAVWQLVASGGGTLLWTWVGIAAGAWAHRKPVSKKAAVGFYNVRRPEST